MNSLKKTILFLLITISSIISYAKDECILAGLENMEKREFLNSFQTTQNKKLILETQWKIQDLLEEYPSEQYHYVVLGDLAALTMPFIENTLGENHVKALTTFFPVSHLEHFPDTEQSIKVAREIIFQKPDEKNKKTLFIYMTRYDEDLNKALSILSRIIPLHDDEKSKLTFIIPHKKDFAHNFLHKIYSISEANNINTNILFLESLETFITLEKDAYNSVMKYLAPTAVIDASTMDESNFLHSLQEEKPSNPCYQRLKETIYKLYLQREPRPELTTEQACQNEFLNYHETQSFLRELRLSKFTEDIHKTTIAINDLLSSYPISDYHYLLLGDNTAVVTTLLKKQLAPEVFDEFVSVSPTESLHLLRRGELHWKEDQKIKDLGSHFLFPIQDSRKNIILHTLGPYDMERQIPSVLNYYIDTENWNNLHFVFLIPLPEQGNTRIKEVLTEEASKYEMNIDVIYIESMKNIIESAQYKKNAFRKLNPYVPINSHAKIGELSYILKNKKWIINPCFKLLEQVISDQLSQEKVEL